MLLVLVVVVVVVVGLFWGQTKENILLAYLETPYIFHPRLERIPTDIPIHPHLPSVESLRL
jgi:hypothetical protein